MFTKPSNLLASTVLPLPVAGDPVLSKGILSFTGLPAGFPYKSILGYKKTVYSAGAAQVNTLDFAGINAANNTLYSLTIVKNSPIGDRVKPYVVFSPASGSTPASIRTQFVNEINNDETRWVNAAPGAGSTFTLTEILSFDIQGFVVSEMPTGATNAATIPHTEDSGTLAEVQIYDSTVSSGTYSKFEFDILVDANSAGNSGKSGYVEKVIVWANTAAPDYALFLATLEDAGAGILKGKATVSLYLAVA